MVNYSLRHEFLGYWLPDQRARIKNASSIRPGPNFAEFFCSSFGLWCNEGASPQPLTYGHMKLNEVSRQLPVLISTARPPIFSNWSPYWNLNRCTQSETEAVDPPTRAANSKWMRTADPGSRVLPEPWYIRQTEKTFRRKLIMLYLLVMGRASGYHIQFGPIILNPAALAGCGAQLAGLLIATTRGPWIPKRLRLC